MQVIFRYPTQWVVVAGLYIFIYVHHISFFYCPTPKEVGVRKDHSVVILFSVVWRIRGYLLNLCQHYKKLARDQTTLAVLSFFDYEQWKANLRICKLKNIPVLRTFAWYVYQTILHRLRYAVALNIISNSCLWLSEIMNNNYRSPAHELVKSWAHFFQNDYPLYYLNLFLYVTEAIISLSNKFSPKYLLLNL